jgi:hypothetical protein
MSWINARENWRSNQELTIERNWQHWETRHKMKTNKAKHTTQKTKMMSNKNDTKNLEWTQSPLNGKRSLTPTRTPPNTWSEASRPWMARSPCLQQGPHQKPVVNPVTLEWQEVPVSNKNDTKTWSELSHPWMTRSPCLQQGPHQIPGVNPVTLEWQEVPVSNKDHTKNLEWTQSPLNGKKSLSPTRNQPYYL